MLKRGILILTILVILSCLLLGILILVHDSTRSDSLLGPNKPSPTQWESIQQKAPAKIIPEKTTLIQQRNNN